MVNQEQASLSWLDEEINSAVFSDRRHARRFKSLMQKLWRGMGNSLPFAFQDNAATKAAYRFLHTAGLIKTGNDTGINCGILMHSSLAVTTSGHPLGLTAVKFWTRKKFKGTNALKRKINPTRVPIEEKESYRWLKNLRQSTALLQCRNDVFLLVSVRVIFTSCIAWHRS